MTTTTGQRVGDSSTEMIVTIPLSQADQDIQTQAVELQAGIESLPENVALETLTTGGKHAFRDIVDGVGVKTRHYYDFDTEQVTVTDGLRGTGIHVAPKETLPLSQAPEDLQLEAADVLSRLESFQKNPGTVINKPKPSELSSSPETITEGPRVLQYI